MAVNLGLIADAVQQQFLQNIQQTIADGITDGSSARPSDENLRHAGTLLGATSLAPNEIYDALRTAQTNGRPLGDPAIPVDEMRPALQAAQQQQNQRVEQIAQDLASSSLSPENLQFLQQVAGTQTLNKTEMKQAIQALQQRVRDEEMNPFAEPDAAQIRTALQTAQQQKNERIEAIGQQIGRSETPSTEDLSFLRSATGLPPASDANAISDAQLIQAIKDKQLAVYQNTGMMELSHDQILGVLQNAQAQPRVNAPGTPGLPSSTDPNSPDFVGLPAPLNAAQQNAQDAFRHAMQANPRIRLYEETTERSVDLLVRNAGRTPPNYNELEAALVNLDRASEAGRGTANHVLNGNTALLNSTHSNYQAAIAQVRTAREGGAPLPANFAETQLESTANWLTGGNRAAEVHNRFTTHPENVARGPHVSNPALPWQTVAGVGPGQAAGRPGPAAAAGPAGNDLEHILQYLIALAQGRNTGEHGVAPHTAPSGPAAGAPAPGLAGSGMTPGGAGTPRATSAIMNDYATNVIGLSGAAATNLANSLTAAWRNNGRDPESQEVKRHLEATLAAHKELHDRVVGTLSKPVADGGLGLTREAAETQWRAYANSPAGQQALNGANVNQLHQMRDNTQTAVTVVRAVDALPALARTAVSGVSDALGIDLGRLASTVIAAARPREAGGPTPT